MKRPSYDISPKRDKQNTIAYVLILDNVIKNIYLRIPAGEGPVTERALCHERRDSCSPRPDHGDQQGHQYLNK